MLRREDVPEGGKIDAAAALCGRLARDGEKVLVFGGDLDRLRELQARIAATERLEALLYDDAPSLEARDRLVARFRDPEGPMLLLSGESGGEGRNFQFASHLVCLDLPDSPLTLEQRIGRLDRLGQSRPVEIHVLPEPGEEAFLADLYEKEIGIFEEPVGGLDAVLASVPEELAALRARRTEKARQAFRRGIASRVAEGRRAQHEGYDPLLDVRSASIPELTALVSAAFARMGEDPPGEDEEIGASLATLSRWLEEELEELVVEAGRRVGMDVDTDENVHPFEAAFTFGSSMRIEALPGMEIPAEERTLLGSFWRETAVVREELEWFATGHRLAEALLELARDGDAGRTAFLQSRAAPAQRRPLPALEAALAGAGRPGAGRPRPLPAGLPLPRRVAPRRCWWTWAPATPSSTAAPPGSRSPSTGPATPGARPRRPRWSSRPPRPPRRRARAELSRRVARAVKKLAAHADAEEERLLASARDGGASREAVERALVSRAPAPGAGRGGAPQGGPRARRRRGGPPGVACPPCRRRPAPTSPICSSPGEGCTRGRPSPSPAAWWSRWGSRRRASSGSGLAGKALLPGLVSAHGHSFQRAIRGRTQVRHPGRSDFWSWRDGHVPGGRAARPRGRVRGGAHGLPRGGLRRHHRRGRVSLPVEGPGRAALRRSGAAGPGGRSGRPGRSGSASRCSAAPTRGAGRASRPARSSSASSTGRRRRSWRARSAWPGSRSATRP